MGGWVGGGDVSPSCGQPNRRCSGSLGETVDVVGNVDQMVLKR